MKRLLLALPLLTACGTIPPSISSGDSFSTEHGAARFADATTGAKEYCAGRGKEAKHIGTDRISAFQSVSRFECVPK